MYSCSIIIVAYNSCDFIPACLKSIRDACENVDAQVIVLDNGSESPILPEIKAFFPEVQWIDSKVNLGFGKGCNLAEKQATKPYLFFINPDTVVSRDSFTKVLDFMSDFGNIQDDRSSLVFPEEQALGELQYDLRRSRRNDRGRCH